MSIIYILFLFSSFFLISCKKNNPEPNYPTVINKLPASTLTQMKASYFQKNNYLITSLNEFGFCDNFSSGFK